MTTDTRPTVVCDIEIYHGFLLISFTRVSDGAVRTFEWSNRSTIDWEKVRTILMGSRIITYNGKGFDIPLIWYALGGASLADVKRACDQIIEGGVKYWEVENLLGIRVPQIDHIDLIEPQPNAFASLKTLNGRLHGKRMQDLPYPPTHRPTHDEMDNLTEYCGNDLDATELLFNALAEPLAIREDLSARWGTDLRSKSDAQVGETIIRKRVKQITGEDPQKVDTPAGHLFPYRPPAYIRFEHPVLVDILERLRTTEFIVKSNGKVDLPEWLDGREVVIGETTYVMGIGGLHSTEKNRTVLSDADHVLIDADVAAYYPEIILGSGLYPRSLGKAFLEAYAGIKQDRIKAKRRAQEIKRELKTSPANVEALKIELDRRTAEDKGGKIQINGLFGKLGSPYSIVYAPHLMIAVTLTGQLALLMLIQRAEAAGIPVVSANTDGLVFRIPRVLAGMPIENARLTGAGVLRDILEQWERDTGFELECVAYRGLYSQSVNTYIAITEDGKTKRKGVLANPRAEGDIRTQLMNNPSMNVCADAVVEFLSKGTPIDDTIRARRDIRDFVTVVKVQGGGTWRGEYLGKVVRYIWSPGGEEILYKDPHPTTGNYKKVSKTDGCLPMMELPDEFPEHLIDYDRYIEAARDILADVGAVARPIPFKRPKVYKVHRRAWLALSIAA
jgi:hypothetical protein